MTEIQTNGETLAVPDDLAGLLAELDAGDPATRCRAAQALARFPEAAAPLGEHLRREGESRVREAILDTLIRLEGQVAAACLIECLCGRDTTLCRETLAAMQALPRERVSGLIVTWLTGS